MQAISHQTATFLSVKLEQYGLNKIASSMANIFTSTLGNTI